MKTMTLTGINKMEMREIAKPCIKDDFDVLVRVGAVGVCGSDVHYYETGRIGSQVVEYPFVAGHECAGIVEETGAGVTRVKPGNRIAVEPAVSCGECDQCRAGRPNTCRKLLFLGCPGQMSGCLCEYIVMPQQCCFPIPAEMTLEQAVVSEPLSIGVYAVMQAAPVRGAHIAILGAGPIGLCVLLAARCSGAGPVYMTDKIDARCARAGAMGAAWSGNPDSGDIVREISGREPMGLDIVFECSGSQEAIDQAFDLLKPGGKLMVLGIPRFERISFAADLVRRKELCIRNVRRQRECVQSALDMIANGTIDVEPMITHHFPFEQTRAAFECVAGYCDGVIKAIIDIGGCHA